MFLITLKNQNLPSEFLKVRMVPVNPNTIQLYTILWNFSQIPKNANFVFFLMTYPSQVTGVGMYDLDKVGVAGVEASV